jgi:hypothetical protein
MAGWIGPGSNSAYCRLQLPRRAVPPPRALPGQRDESNGQMTDGEKNTPIAGPLPSNQLALFVPLRPGQIHVWHLRRTGGHGVIDWLMGHHDGHKLHHNQALPQNAASVQVPHGQTALHFGNPALPLFELVSFEDLPLDHRAAQLVRPQRTVLLLRDPFNTFASRLQRIRQDPAQARLLAIIPALWKRYAHEFLEPHYLPDAVRINFNRWYLSADYRKTVSERLGWHFTDRGFGSKRGWVFSHGSSFGDNDPTNLDLLNRWKTFQDDKEFRSYLDDEVCELSKRIFDLQIPL